MTKETTLLMASVCGKEKCNNCGYMADLNLEMSDMHQIIYCHSCHYVQEICNNLLEKKSLESEYKPWIDKGTITLTIKKNSYILIEGIKNPKLLEGKGNKLCLDVCKKCAGYSIKSKNYNHLCCKILGNIRIEKMDLIPDDCPYYMEQLISK